MTLTYIELMGEWHLDPEHSLLAVSLVLGFVRLLHVVTVALERRLRYE